MSNGGLQSSKRSEQQMSDMIRSTSLSHLCDSTKMDVTPRSIKSYTTQKGKKPFDNWLKSLKDKKAIARILQRIDRVSLGNFGDCRSVGEGVFELRVHFGPGFRVYFGIANEQLIILLSGGDKGSQKKDISTAQTYWKEYKENAY